MPTLLNVTVSGELVVPTVCAGNVSEVGVMTTPVPVPLREIPRKLSKALLSMITVALFPPDAWGANDTVIVQVPNGASVLPQVVVMTKSETKLPVTERLVIEMLMPLWLVTVATFAVLV